MSTLLRLTGRDALGLLHRITTQHLRDLAPGHCATTLFCDFRGRVLHRVAVARTSDAIYLARPDAPGDELAAAIDRQIFRDDVRIENLSAAATVHATRTTTGTAGTTVEHDAAPTALHLANAITWRIGDAPAASLTEAERIHLGAPRHGHEISDTFNPYEINVATDVHLDKGCFTGQEALLRMQTYGGVRRRLTLLEGTGASPNSGDTLRRGDADAGVITSVATEGDAWVALAVVRHDALESGEPLTTDAANITRATPFPESRPLGLPEPRAAT